MDSSLLSTVEPFSQLDDSLLGPPSGVVLLQLFIPPYYYGSYLVFMPDGVPIGVIDAASAALLRHTQEAPATRAELTKHDSAVAATRIDALQRAGLLVHRDERSIIHWIEPGGTSHTRHSGPGAERFIQDFYTYFGSVFYEGSPLIDSHQFCLNQLSKYFPVGTSTICLDAGCGSGYYSSALAQLGHFVYACDISSTRIDSVSRQPQHPGIIAPLQCNIDAIPLASGSIDFIMCNFVLEHVADPYDVIDELSRLLRVGGRILISVPSFNIRDTLAAWIHSELPSLNFEHLRSYGLVPKTHPWCEPILDTLDYLQMRNVMIEVIEGIDILQGLWEPWLSAISQVAMQLGDGFSKSWPWNCLGQQTIMIGRKVT